MATATTFRVVFEGCREGESLGVTGDCPALGNWTTFKRCEKNASHQWILSSVTLPSAHPTSYKYVVVSSEGKLRAAETLQEHRSVAPQTSVVDDGVITLHTMRPSKLDDEVEFHVTLLSCCCCESEKDIDISLIDPTTKHRHPLIVCPRDVVHGKRRDTRVPAGVAKRLVMVLKVANKGIAMISAPELAACRGRLTRPVMTATGEHAGDVSLDFLVVFPSTVQPSSSPAQQEDLSVKATKYSKFIGHRGGGATQIDPIKNQVMLENTLISFCEASSVWQCEGVEFDVHLTSDRVAVIFHNDRIPISVGPTTDGWEDTTIDVPIPRLSYDDFTKLKPMVHFKPMVRQYYDAKRKAAGLPTVTEQFVAASSALPSRLTREDGDLPLHDVSSAGKMATKGPLRQRREYPAKGTPQAKKQGLDKDLAYMPRAVAVPKLEELLQHVPQKTGFDVEIKYPETLTEERLQAYEERNMYLDEIIRVVNEGSFHNPRWIFYSSFDPDICMMLTRKQSRHSVFFLTTGNLDDELPDLCLIPDIKKAIDMAYSMGLAGIVTDSEFLLKQPHLIKYAHDKGLAVQTYGIPSNDIPECVKKQLELNVDAIISDYVKKVSK